MKVTQFHLRIAVLSLGVILILYGVVKMLWKVDFGPWVEQNLPNGIFIGAAAIFVWNRSLYNKEQKRLKDEAAKEKEGEAAPEEPSAEDTKKDV